MKRADSNSWTESTAQNEPIEFPRPNLECVSDNHVRVLRCPERITQGPNTRNRRTPPPQTHQDGYSTSIHRLFGNATVPRTRIGCVCHSNFCFGAPFPSLVALCHSQPTIEYCNSYDNFQTNIAVNLNSLQLISRGPQSELYRCASVKVLCPPLLCGGCYPATLHEGRISLYGW